MQAHKLSPDTIATASTPPGFDPNRFPILARHWPGLPPTCEHISAPPARVLARFDVIDVEVGPKGLGP